MAGLYQRAAEIREELEKDDPVELDFSNLDAEADIPEEERSSILAWIDKNLARNREEIEEEQFSLPQERRGLFLPIIINVASAAIIAGGVLFFSLYYRQEQQDLVSTQDSGVIVQNQIFEVLKKESEQRLLEKEVEISSVQARLREATAERENLKQEAEARISASEEELRSEYEKAAEELRARLQREGASEAAIADRLNELRTENESELQRQIEIIRAEIDGQIAAKEQEIQAREAAYRADLLEAEEELIAIRSEAQRREEDLQSRQELAFQELDEMREERTRLSDVLESFRSGLVEISGAMNDGDLAAALVAIRSYRSAAGQVQEENEDIQAVIRTLLLVAASLEALTAANAAYRNDVESEIAATARDEYRRELEQPVLRGEAFRRAGNDTQAANFYREALENVTPLSVAYQRLLEIELAAADTVSKTAADRIRQELNAEIASAKTDATSAESKLRTRIAELESQAIDLRGQISNLQDRMSSEAERSESILAQSKQAGLERDRAYRSVGVLRNSLAESLSRAEEYEEASEVELLALLRAKTTFKKILSDDAIAGEYPDLAEYLDTYYETVSLDAQIKTELELLESTIESLDGILSGG